MAKRVNYNFEFTFRAKAELLFTYISTPYNLSTWFVDDAEINGDIYTFTWNKSSERVKLDKFVIKKKVSFLWIDREEEESLTFSIETDEVTGGTQLIVSDYDEEDQIDEARMWWEGAIQNLKRVIGG